MSQQSKKNKTGQTPSKNDAQNNYSYSNLKNNYLGRISSPVQSTEENERRQGIRDEKTPEQMFEIRKLSTEQSAYYNVNKG